MRGARDSADAVIAHGSDSRLVDRVTAHEPLALDAFVRHSLDSGDGTPEFRAWLRRAARRLAVA